MADDEPGLINIEFESDAGLSVDTPEAVAGGGGSGPWPMVIVALIVGGLLLGLIWFSSGDDSSAAPEDLEEQVDAPVEPEDPPEEEVVDEVVDEPVIPASSNASLAVETFQLESFSEVALLDDELFALDSVAFSAPTSSPQLWRSRNGTNWQPVATEVLVNGVPSTIDYDWAGLSSFDGGLSIDGLATDSQISLVSRDGVVWEPISDDGSIGLFPVAALPDDSVVGVSIRGSEDLAQFVEDHTTATNVESVCFAELQTVFECDSGVGWDITEETIDSAVGSEVVLECFARAFTDFRLFRELFLVHPVGDTSATQPSEVRLNAFAASLVVLPDGRLAGASELLPERDLTPCEGLEEFEEADPDPLFVLDLIRDTVVRYPIPSGFQDNGVPEVIGGISDAGTNLLLTKFRGQLWSLDLDSGVWTNLEVNAFQDRYVASDSGERLYALDGEDLIVLDLVVRNGELEVVETVVFAPTDLGGSLSFIGSASDDRVTIGSSGSVWLANVPRGLRCAEQFAEAIAGAGVLRNC